MAPEEPRRKTRRRHSDKTSSRRARVEESGGQAEADDQVPVKPQTIDELREARLEYLAQSPEERSQKMKYIGEKTVVTKVPVTREESRSTRRTTGESRSRRPSDSGRKRSEPRPRAQEEEDSGDEYVYGRPEPVAEEQISSAPPRDSAGRRKSETPRRSQTRRTSSNHVSKRSEERHKTPRRNTEPARRRNSSGIDERDTPDRPSPRERARPPLRKSATSIRDKPRSSLERSPIAIRPKPEVGVARSAVSLDPPKKAPSIISSFLGPRPTIPEKKISCLTCGSDDVPISKSARLACTHRMCHSCLRRIFNMSVSDPSHMPPRCCTSEHIPLKHVDRLFDQAFKKTWNRKFQEYTTNNRIYCPNRGCGEWIKPNHITTESGRKVGKCKRCSTRVCCTCNNKMHTSKDCPKDPATKQFVEIAKQKGWQRCYNCSAMVELKEGCNHMTCWCTAEFCMVCGMKWKSCDCPWFNYEQIDAQIDPLRAQQALDRRRDQEQRDEALARRMEVLGIDEEDDGRMFGIGNGAGHHMNANFIQQAREALTANYQVAEQAARGLLNGLVTGRENRLPGLPVAPAQTEQLLRQPSRRVAVAVAAVVDPAEPEGIARRPARQRTVRRRSDQLNIPPAAAGFDGRGQPANVQDRRIREWANGVLPS